MKFLKNIGAFFLAIFAFICSIFSIAGVALLHPFCWIVMGILGFGFNMVTGTSFGGSLLYGLGAIGVTPILGLVVGGISAILTLISLHYLQE